MRKTQKPEVVGPGGARRQDRKPGAEDAAGSLDFGASAPGDAHLWRKVAESARPLRHKRARAQTPSKIFTESAPEKSAPPKRPPRPSLEPPLPTLHPGAAPDVDRATATRLRKGEMAIDATLDLHGLTQKEAHAALLGQIARAHALGQRCLLVITGKGGKLDKDGGTTGVLRANMPRWLNEQPARAHVLAFAQARPRHGGEGALYVLLRRIREARAR